MTYFRNNLLALSIAATLAGVALPAAAESKIDLETLVRQQAARIEALEQRLSVLEQPGATAPADVQLAAAIADTRQEDIATLQAQVAALGAGGGGSGGGGNTSWRRGGPELRSGDGFFTMHPRGRIMTDFSSTRGSNFAARNITGTEMRAVRLGAEGTIGDLGYKIDADFADNTVSIKDAYISYESRIGSLPAEYYVGNKLKDRSIDGSTTLVRTPFMERNAVASVGAPDSGYFGLGMQAKVFGNNWHASASITGDDISNPGNATDTVAYSVRAHWNPIKRPSGFVHVGGWYFYEDLGADVTSINKTPRIGQSFNDNLRVSASSIANVTNNHAYGTELGGVFRNFWAFGEYTERTINSRTAVSFDQKATSIYAGWLITGEKPGFTTRSGLWGTTRVLNPVTDGGKGAFELVARYDNYDFTDVARGGEGTSYTVGLNWYLNNWSRLMVNYVRWTTDNKVGAYQGKDSGDSIGVRAQVAF